MRFLRALGLGAVGSSVLTFIQGCTPAEFLTALLIFLGLALPSHNVVKEDLQQAINDAQPGQTIYVGSSEFDEDIVIDVDNLTVVCSGSVINGVLTILVDNVTISGCTFEKLETTPDGFLNLTLVGTTIYGQVLSINIACQDVVNVGDGIQPSVTAATVGDTICIGPGIHEEQVEVAKALTLLGIGNGAVIQAPDSLTLFFTTSVNNYPIVYIHDTNDVTLRNLVVDGAGKGNANYRFVGIGFNNAGGVINKVEVTDVRDSPFSGSQHGTAIYSWNDDTISRTITVKNSDIHDFQKSGIVLNADTSTPLVITVDNNTVTGHGATTITAQNGIQAYGNLITGTISNNTVTGIAYDNTLAATKWVATSILLYFPDVDVIGNTISNAHVGVYNYDGAGQIKGNKITIEKIGVYAFGIIATDPPRAVASPLLDPWAGPTGNGRPAGVPMPAVAGSTLDVDVIDNMVNFSGADNTVTWGIDAEAGYSSQDLDFVATGNTVTGFDVGIGLYKCTSGCSSGVFTTLELHMNNITGNTTGMDSNVDYLTADAENNWWGHASGPSGVGPGSGDAVSANIDYTPWAVASF